MEKYRSPVYRVIAVPIDKVVANNYNPNVVAPPEMKLLELSIWEDGYTMPCVCYYLKDEDKYEIVDGFHRYLVMKTSERIYNRPGDCDRQGSVRADGIHYQAQPGERNALG